MYDPRVALARADHAGRHEESARLARALVETFEAAGLDTVVVNAAGCGSHLKDLGPMFADDPAFQARACLLYTSPSPRD